jgi:hypothetical protein
MRSYYVGLDVDLIVEEVVGRETWSWRDRAIQTRRDAHLLMREIKSNIGKFLSDISLYTLIQYISPASKLTLGPGEVPLTMMICFSARHDCVAFCSISEAHYLGRTINHEFQHRQLRLRHTSGKMELHITLKETSRQGTFRVKY